MKGSASRPIFIVGAGPGIGMAVARRFGREGHSICMVARSRQRLDEHVAELAREDIVADAAVGDILEPATLRAAIAELAERLGPAQILCFSPLPDVGLIGPVAETTAEQVSAALALNAVGATAAVEQVLPGIGEHGSLLFVTGGAAIEPKPERAVSAIAYGAEVAYARLLYEGLRPDVHVGVTTIVGPVGEGKRHEPADIAERLYEHHAERREFQQIVR